ncbi:MAG: hypothetical protein H6600_03150 [Flavobacteriales bacterium]|nr:hypothetical protein [Flavobacteriales bacterium]
MLLLILLLIWTCETSIYHSQNHIGIEINRIEGDMYYPAIFDRSSGFETGIVYQRDRIFNIEKLIFHSQLTILKRINPSNNGEIFQTLPQLGFSYRLGNKRITFEPILGFYTKALLSYHNFYEYGQRVDSKLLTLGSFVRPQITHQINDNIWISIYGSARFDLTPTFVYWYSTTFEMRKYSLLYGIQILYKLNKKLNTELNSDQY